jgi:hypothetical protein
MFIPIPFEADGDRPALFVDIGQFHSQHAVPSGDVVPVSDALTRTKKQRKDRFIAIGSGSIDELFRRGRRERPVNFPRDSSSEFPSTPACGPISAGETVASVSGESCRNGIGSLEPRSTAKILVALNTEREIRGQYA